VNHRRLDTGPPLPSLDRLDASRRHTAARGVLGAGPNGLLPGLRVREQPRTGCCLNGLGFSATGLMHCSVWCSVLLPQQHDLAAVLFDVA